MGELFRRFGAKPRLTLELVVASFFASVLALAMPIFVIQVLNRYVAHGIDVTLATLVVGALIAIILEFVFRQVRQNLALGVSDEADVILSEAGVSSLLRARHSALEAIPLGRRLQAIAGLNYSQNAYSALNICSLLDLPFAFLFLGALFLLDSTLGIIASLFCFIGFVSGSLAMFSMRKPTRKSMMLASQMAPIISTAARELETVRVFNAGPFLNRVWSQCQEEFNHLKYFLIARQGLIQSIVQTSVALTGVAIISVGAILVVQGELDVGALIGANILAARALQPIYRFTQLVESFVTAQESIQMLGEIAMLPKESREGSAKRNYGGGLTFRDLAFSYPGSKSPLFESLSLEIEPGHAVLGFGANSTGKTTLARLIAGLIEPSRGEILGDGINLRQVSPEWWRKQIIYLPQETVLINGTIQENICIANQDMGEKEAQELVDRIGLREFVDTSKDGIRTAITDNGRQLAVGTRRRLAFARALATDGPLVILDEPTEGFDPAGTKLVNSIVTELSRQGRTIIAFTHDSTSTKGTHLAIDLNEKPIPKIIKQSEDVKL